MNASHEKVVVFLPAYFAEHTLASVHAKIPKHCVDDIVLVDDASKDRIENVAHRLGLKFYRNEKNLGYGGNVKVCFARAADVDADILVELHPDDQYDPAAIPPALEKMKEGYDFVIGSRFLGPGAVFAHRMPLWKYAINRLSTLVARTVLGVHLTDFHCGFRVYRRTMIQALPFMRNDNDYLFSFQVIAQACHAGFRISEVPVICRYTPEATQIRFAGCMQYGWGALKTLWAYALAKCGKSHPLFMPTAPAAGILHVD